MGSLVSIVSLSQGLEKFDEILPRIQDSRSLNSSTQGKSKWDNYWDDVGWGHWGPNSGLVGSGEALRVQIWVDWFHSLWFD